MYETADLDKLIKKINAKRRKLHELLADGMFQNPDLILKISREIDELIIQYYKLKK